MEHRPQSDDATEDHRRTIAETDELLQARAVSHPDEGPVQRCRICDEVFPLTHDHWHKDSHQPSGFQNACKDCRRAEQNLVTNKRAVDAIEQLDDQLLEGLGAVDRTLGVSNIPHASELFEHIMRAFGGPEMYAQHLAATYVAAKPGSSIREKILRQISNIGLKLTLSGHTEDDVRSMSDGEIEDRLKKALTVYTPDGGDEVAKPAV